MSFIGGSKETHVASTVYNMAGDEMDRPHYLKSLILRNILSGTKRGMGETVNQGYIKGPGITYRSFFRWANENYDDIGMPTGTISASNSVIPDNVAPHIPVGPNERAWVQEAWIEEADYSFWVEQWFMENAPELINTDWTADINDNTYLITITFEDNTTHSFMPTNFVPGNQYVLAYYSIVTGETDGPIVQGPLIPLAPSEPFPSTSGWTLVSDNTVEEEATLVTHTHTVVSYSDSTPDDVTDDYDPVDTPYDVRTRVYSRDTRLPDDPDNPLDQILIKREYMTFFEDMEIGQTETTNVSEEVVGGVTITTTTTITQDVLEPTRAYRIDEQENIYREYSPLKYFIYRIGSGITELDNLVDIIDSFGQFFPIIPLRYESRMISEEYRPQVYELAKKAFRKATGGGNYDKVSEQIADHEDVDDIDFTYVVFGVSLNVVDKSCRKYLYQFFEKMMADQRGGETAYATLLSDIQAYNTAYAAWRAWRQSDEPEGPEPTLPPRPSIFNNEIRINSSGSYNTEYDVRISWNYISEKLFNGIGRTGAKKGDLWFTDEGEDDIEATIYAPKQRDGLGNSIKFQSNKIGKIRLYWQYEDNQYKYLDIIGLIHRNYVYDGKRVKITSREALSDSEESGFIVPLHYGTFREMSLVDATQMSTASMFLVFNSYEVVKTPWWQSGFFKIIFVVVIAVGSVLFTGGAGLGLLGSHLAVGGALGFTGMTAAIIGSVANALAALILTSLISYAAVALFGEQWGMMIGAIISFVAMNAIMNFHMTGSFNFNIADLMRADNLLKLTDALVNGYQGFVAGEISSMQSELERIQEEADAELRRIRNAYINEFGVGGGQIDPLMFVGNSPVMAESRDTFLSRTLMTGSDIATMSHDMLYDFVDLTLTLPNAFT